ncbi:type II secretion system protein [Permianibacter sp. IMCC34836]|uniref:PilW family protein n=1 Tax=Permianibacter fluminis TaxID=2738515 RepID=UPI001554015F|nr:type II secretion system protein [Permianibacter fluminis]NQD37290.1 type II secretion system protein [Permianibacter fluminis]
MVTRARGYTLIELVIVIAILGVIGVGLISIYTTSIRQYVEANLRAELSASARFAVERLSRELRNALPNSIRVTSDGDCVEFRPVQLGSTYVDLPLTSASSTVTAAAFTLPAGSWSLSVMPLLTGNGSSSDMYGPSPLATAGIASVGAPDANNMVSITLTAAKQFPRSSPGRRLFIVGAPVSFCVTAANQIRRYTGYASTVVQPTKNDLSGGTLLAENVQVSDVSNTAFRYTSGSLERNAVLSLQLRLSAGTETLRYAHEVLIRNVP